MTTPPLVLVKWHDAWSDHDQSDAKDHRADYLVQTVGFLLEDGELISVAQELLPDGDGFRAVTHVHRGMVESVTELQELAEELRNGLESRTPSDPPRIGPTSQP